jgi:sister chromatid cohesion protein PDS5
LLKHEDDNVKVLLATCFCEITRITAPDAPYNDDILRVTIISFKPPSGWFI